MRSFRLKESDVKRLSRRFSEQETEIENLRLHERRFSREMLSQVATRLHLSPLTKNNAISKDHLRLSTAARIGIILLFSWRLFRRTMSFQLVRLSVWYSHFSLEF